jgi:hypothetical protein
MLHAEASADGALRAVAVAPRIRLTALAFAAVTLAVAPVAYWSMFTGFRGFDDEGIFLVTLRDYLSGHPVLTPYVPLYGPLYYEVTAGLFKVLGLQPAHDTGRWVTLVVWLGASAVSGLAALRLTQRLWIGLGALLVTFIVLMALANEPMSTYGLSSVLLLTMTWAAALRSTWPRVTAAVIGAGIGGLFLIKVNVGALAAVAVAFAWAGSLPARHRRVLLPAIAVLIAALPIVLTASLLDRASVLEFAILVALSAAAVGISAVAAPAGPAPQPATKWLAGGAVFLALGCIGVALAGGSHLEDGWHALFLFAIRFPRVFTWPLNINPFDDAWAALWLAVVLVMFRRGTGAAVPGAVAGVVRIGAGFLTWASILLLPIPVFLLGLPLAWLATQAPRGDSQNPVDPYARLLLPALAVLESLQAYPVAGSQLSLAALGLVPVAAMTLNDGIRQLRLLDAPRPKWVEIVSWAAPATLLTTIVVILELLGFLAMGSFSGGTPLGLPGAESVRLPAQQAAQLRGVVDAVDRNECSSLITFPGMNSFYLWTSQDGFRQTRYGQWYLTLDSSQQQSIVQQVEGQPRPCVIKNQKLIDFWTSGRPAPSGPLVDFINGNFVDAGTFGDYELLVRASP